MLDVVTAQSISHQVGPQRRPIRAVARETGVSRNTVRRYARGAEPGESGQSKARSSPKTDRAREALRALLDEFEARQGKKQRLTAYRAFVLLTARGVDVGYSIVKKLVVEERRRTAEVFVPLTWHKGEAALVDFFEVLIDVEEPLGARVESTIETDGVTLYRVRAALFLMRLPASGIDVVSLYPRQDQVCFLDGHVRAFRQLGGVPSRIGYDNLKPAVKKLVGNGRQLQQRFVALANHYRFEPVFARPYTGHDKGAVEARGKGFRGQYLTPIPRGRTLLDVAADLVLDLDEHQQDEVRHLQPLPAVDFDARRHVVASVSSRSVLQVDGVTCSVPEHLARTDVDVFAGPFAFDVVGRDGTSVTHLRAAFGSKRIDYRHYLKTLSEKPQAVRQVASTLVAQLGEPFSSTWRSLLDEHDPIDAARVFCRVLRRVHDVGFDAAAQECLRGEAGWRGARAPPAKASSSSFEVPKALRVDVQTSSLAIYDALLGATP
jgi:transposase